ncbi:MogA/MoaB family molybdenum cofactor biosynthesis protein [Methanocaldococcus fervens]|uniref:Molybdenum cofactor synthesis domain protein n=1 Tax=Methanocaldococcus fervens (strain DSM 4213 / JCM 15782 / AG86) TaxID=573064 RepID=C7P646_METFA|nr:MogA/MoaB family molybdenum cofactor biosynthesis protein [Methanocaldococcus fervens]ACV24028.1 molybdenum cofactor synthesis domain protein [Methanocaldococcus fervens AG86]
MHKRIKIEDIKFAVVTVSDSRYNSLIKGEKIEDKSGNLLKHELNAKIYTIIPDNKNMIKGIVEHIVESFDVDCIVFTGGTGIAERDVTIEALKEIFEKELDGFKIIFQKLSYEEVGFSAILSRATAGIYKGKIIYALPGSVNACKTALKIIKEETGHILGHLREG